MIQNKYTCALNRHTIMAIGWSVFLLLSFTARGGVLDFMFSKYVTYNIHVVDENQQSLPGATLWILRSGSSRPDITPALMHRIVSRYAQNMDADYVHSSDSWGAHPSLEVEYVDDNGNIEIKYEENAIGNQDELPISIAVIKRGYKVQVQSEKSPLRSTRNITFTLVRDTTVEVEPLLNEFDQLRSKIIAFKSSKLNEPQLAKALQNVHANIRNIATLLEQQNKPDMAAVVYDYLARMPSIDIEYDAAGEIAIRGFTNGYNKHDKQRKADRDRSLQLNVTNPNLMFEVLIEGMFDLGIVWAAERTDKFALREEFIRETENLFSKYRSRVWPGRYYYLILAYGGQSKPEKACELLNEFYRFEPEYYTKSKWEDMAGGIRNGIKFEKWALIKKTNPNIKLEEIDKMVDFHCAIK